MVADDRVDLSVVGNEVRAGAPRRLRGLLEVREVGILTFPYRETVHLQAVIVLAAGAGLDRLPAEAGVVLAGINLPCFHLDPWQLSAGVKVRLVSGLVSGSIIRTDD